MRNLVVYYTRSGHTETVAQEIAKIVNGELRRIETANEIGFVSAIIASLLGIKSKIKPIDFNAGDYDNIFIGGPVWAGKSATPLNTFLDNTNFKNKNVFVFITQGDNKEPEDVYELIKKCIIINGGKTAGSFFVQTDMKKLPDSEMVKSKVMDWIGKNNLERLIR